MFLQNVLLLLCFYVIILQTVNCEDGNFFLKVAKNVPRIGKRNKNTNNDDFEKFFLKASKSVPRIGRRGKPEEEFAKIEMAKPNLKYPLWSEIAERYEYEPELFISPQYLSKLEEYLGDDPSIYDWEKVRLKRTTSQTADNKELEEYK